jgi:hypothetical protein
VPEGRLWDFIEKIAQSRREGKNRRDGATVSTRVLRLTETTLGRALFAADSVDGGLSEEDKKALDQLQQQKKRKVLRSRARL